ncbi:MAG TPA: bifunctional hydroxymethylpyrimidine kinase/phosphomethylpyrimidine kinase [Acidimicrobiia bacterium]|nr:bifunctional hydroxymethylpyrimidine kinase/phosphomethylpyrimidine kinase [Acidimicrobiia bacterium]
MSEGVRVARAMTIAGSDSGGGAGIEADLKTFEAHGVWGTAAIVAVTAQNTVGVQAFERVSPALVSAQIASVATDIGVDAAQTGMLADAELVETVADAVRTHAISPLVVDPVSVSKHGDALLAADAVDVVRRSLLPLATLVTPNLPEAALLAGVEAPDDRAAMEDVGRRLLDFGPQAVLVKGGHLAGEDAHDCLVSADGVMWLEGPRVPGRHTHGTGCVLSAAVAARLARGEALAEAMAGAKEFVTAAIRRGVALGAGVGPVNPGAVTGRGGDHA